MRKHPTQVQRNFIDWILIKRADLISEQTRRLLERVLMEGYAYGNPALKYRRQTLLNELRDKYLSGFKFDMTTIKYAEYYTNSKLVQEIK